MYTVEVMQPFYTEISGTVSVGSDWEDVVTIPQQETEQAELQLARRLAADTRKFYTEVRIVKWVPGGNIGEVVV